MRSPIIRVDCLGDALTWSCTAKL